MSTEQLIRIATAGIILSAMLLMVGKVETLVYMIGITILTIIFIFLSSYLKKKQD